MKFALAISAIWTIWTLAVHAVPTSVLANSKSLADTHMANNNNAEIVANVVEQHKTLAEQSPPSDSTAANPLVTSSTTAPANPAELRSPPHKRAVYNPSEIYQPNQASNWYAPERLNGHNGWPSDVRDADDEALQVGRLNAAAALASMMLPNVDDDVYGIPVSASRYSEDDSAVGGNGADRYDLDSDVEADDLATLRQRQRFASAANRDDSPDEYELPYLLAAAGAPSYYGPASNAAVYRGPAPLNAYDSLQSLLSQQQVQQQPLAVEYEQIPDAYKPYYFYDSSAAVAERRRRRKRRSTSAPSAAALELRNSLNRESQPLNAAELLQLLALTEAAQQQDRPTPVARGLSPYTEDLIMLMDPAVRFAHRQPPAAVHPAVAQNRNAYELPDDDADFGFDDDLNSNWSDGPVVPSFRHGDRLAAHPARFAAGALPPLRAINARNNNNMHIPNKYPM